jgi:hypothetical protein
MSSIATLALILFIVGVLGLFAQAVGVVIAGRVSPGWLGLGLIGVGWLLTSFPG